MKLLDPHLVVLTEIRDLLRVLAEPALAERDRKVRETIRSIAGKGERKRAAILLMDGTRSRSQIIEASKIDVGALSRLIAELKEDNALIEEDSVPQTICNLPKDFFNESFGAS